MRQKRKALFTYLGLIAFILLFLIGINTGETLAILEKATKICLSCIGLG
jgi:hypothetical protein